MPATDLAGRPQGRRSDRARQHARDASTRRWRRASTWSSSTSSGTGGRVHGRLILAHDFQAAARPGGSRSRRASTISSPDAYAGIELDVDLKPRRLRAASARRAARARPGRPLAGLHDGGGVPARSSASSSRSVRLGLVGAEAAPQPPDHPVHAPPALPGAAVPRRCSRAAGRAGCAPAEIDAAMSHYALVTAAARAGRHAGRRRALRLDRRRRARIAQARALGVTGDHHQRSAAVRHRLIWHDERDLHRAVLAVAVPGGRVSCARSTTFLPSRHSTLTRPRSTMRPPGGGQLEGERRAALHGPGRGRARVARVAPDAPGATALRPSYHWRRMRSHCCGAPRSRGIETRTPTAPGLAGGSQRLTVAQRSACAARLASAAAGASARAASARAARSAALIVHRRGDHAASRSCTRRRRTRRGPRRGVRDGRRGALTRAPDDLAVLSPLEGHHAAQE